MVWQIHEVQEAQWSKDHLPVAGALSAGYYLAVLAHWLLVTSAVSIWFWLRG